MSLHNREARFQRASLLYGVNSQRIPNEIVRSAARPALPTTLKRNRGNKRACEEAMPMNRQLLGYRLYENPFRLTVDSPGRTGQRSTRMDPLLITSPGFLLAHPGSTSAEVA
jgi:hypothetical protein